MVNSTLYPGQQRKAWVVKYEADGLEEHFEEEELRSAKHGPGLISRSRVILPACRCSPSTIFPLNFLERSFFGDLYLSFRLSRSTVGDWPNSSLAASVALRGCGPARAGGGLGFPDQLTKWLLIFRASPWA